MKKLFLATCFLFSIYCYAQIKDSSRADIELRIAMGIDYLYPIEKPIFNTAQGEAVFNLVFKTFKQRLQILQHTPMVTNAQDNNTVNELVDKLMELTELPPTWPELSLMETQRLIILDKLQHRQSIYK